MRNVEITNSRLCAVGKLQESLIILNSMLDSFSQPSSIACIEGTRLGTHLARNTNSGIQPFFSREPQNTSQQDSVNPFAMFGLAVDLQCDFLASVLDPPS